MKIFNFIKEYPVQSFWILVIFALLFLSGNILPITTVTYLFLSWNLFDTFWIQQAFLTHDLNFEKLMSLINNLNILFINAFTIFISLLLMKNTILSFFNKEEEFEKINIKTGILIFFLILNIVILFIFPSLINIFPIRWGI